jgi:archaetidylinositol phosphate synthase
MVSDVQMTHQCLLITLRRFFRNPPESELEYQFKQKSKFLQTPHTQNHIKAISTHKRINISLLAPFEKKALLWLAARMPMWVTPDFCTVTGTIGAAVIMTGYILSRINPNFLWLASLGFVINWFGDSLDGTLARYRHIERPQFGFFIDHTVDTINEMMMLLGLGLTRHVRFDLAGLTLCLYLMFTVLVMIRTSIKAEFKAVYGRLGPTEMRIALILFNTAMYFGGLRVFCISHPVIGQVVFSPYDIVLAAFNLLMFSSFIQTVIQEAITLAKTDRL